MEKELLRLQEASEALDPNSDERIQFESKTWEFLNNSYEELSNGLAWKGESLKNNKEIPIGPAHSIEKLFSHFKDNVLDFGGNHKSRKFMAYISGGGLFSSALAEFMTSTTNMYTAVNFMSPGAVKIENQVIEWLVKEIGLPNTTLGNVYILRSCHMPPLVSAAVKFFMVICHTSFLAIY